MPFAETWVYLETVIQSEVSQKEKIKHCIVQLLSHVRFFVTPWTAACQAPLSSTILWSLLKLMSTCIGDAIQPSQPLSSPSPPALNLSQHQGVFQ